MDCDRGDTQAEVLPIIKAIAKGDGTIVADVSVAIDRADINSHYHNARNDLISMSSNNLEKATITDPKTQQEDEYKAFRTSLMLSYVASNAILFILATQVGTWLYIRILLGSVALLSGFKLLGVIVFVIFRTITDMPCCSAKAKWKKAHPGQTWRGKDYLPSKNSYEVDFSRLESGTRTSRFSLASDTATVLTAD